MPLLSQFLVLCPANQQCCILLLALTCTTCQLLNFTHQLISTIVFLHLCVNIKIWQCTFNHNKLPVTISPLRSKWHFCLIVSTTIHGHFSPESFKLQLCTQKATYSLSMSEHSSSQCTEGKEGNMWWLLNNAPSFTLAALKIMHADTSHWLPAAKFLHARNFYNAV